jgi:hypothetical protein
MSWPADFPKVITQADGATLQSHPLYKAAKAGDNEAASALVKDLVRLDSACALALRYP